MLGSSPLGSKTLGDNPSSPNNVVSNRVGILIAASDNVNHLFAFNDAINLSISATSDAVRVYSTATSPSTISENTIGETATGGALVAATGLYQYDFEAFELQINADDTVVFRPALRESFAETAETQISASDVVEQLFVYDNNAGLNLGDFDVSYEFEGLPVVFQDDYPGLPVGPISFNAIGDIQWEGPQNNQPGLVELTIGAITTEIKSVSRDTQGDLFISVFDNDDGSEGVVRADGKLVYPWFYPKFAYEEDVVTFKAIAASSLDYVFQGLSTDIKSSYPMLPIGPLSVNAIGEVQWEGPQNFQPGLIELTIDDVSPLEIIIQYPEDLGILAIGVDETIVFRPALRESFTETAPLQVSVQDSSYLFEYPLIYSNAGPGLPIGPISANSIAEEQILLGSLAEIYEYSDTLFISFAAQDQIDTNRLEIEIDTVAILEITVEDTVSAAYPSVEIISTEVVANDSIEQLFVFDDTAQFTQITAESIEVAADYDTVLFNVVDVVSTIESTQTFNDTIVLELATTDVVEQKTVFAEVSTASIELSIDDAYEIAYAYVASADFEISETELTEITRNYTTDLNLEITDTTTQSSTRNFDDTVQFATLSSDSIEIVADYDTILLNVVSVTDAIEVEYNYTDTTDLEINTTDTVDRVNNLNEEFDLSIVTTDSIEQLFVFDDTAQFIQLTAASTEVTSDYDTILFNVVNIVSSIELTQTYTDNVILDITANSLDAIGEASTGEIQIDATGSIEQLFVFDDVAQFVQLTAASIEVAADYDTVIFNSLTADDSIEQLFVFDDSTLLEIIISSPEIIGETSTGELVITASETVKQIFVFDDTAQFTQLTAASIEVTSDYDTVLFNSLAANDSIQQLFVFDDVAQFVQISVADIKIAAVFDTITISSLNVTDSISIRLTALDIASINLDSTETIEQLFVFDDTAQFVQITADTTAVIADYDTALFTNITAIDTVEQVFVFNDTRALEIAASSPEIISETSTGEITVNATDAIQQLFVFDDAVQFVQLTADSTAVIADYDTVLFNTVNIIDSIQQLFVFDDTAQFVQLSVTDANLVSVVDTIIVSTVNVTDNISTSLIATDSASINLDSTDTIEQLFVFDDTAQFVQLTADSTVVVSDYDTVLFNIINVASVDSTTLVFADNAVLEIAASSPLSISESSTSTVLINITDNIQQRFVFDDTAQFVQLVASSTEFIADYDTVLFANVSVTDTVEQLFVFDDTAQFVQLAASDNAVVSAYETILLPVIEIVDTVAIVSNIVDTTDIELAATQSIGITEASTGQLVLATPSIQTVAYNIENTVGFVKFVAASEESTLTSTELLAFNIGAISVENISYVFDDTAEFVQFAATGTQIIRDYDTVLFNSFDVETVTNSTLNSVENIATELQAQFDLNIIYNTPAATVALETEVISDVGISYVFDDSAQFTNFIVSDNDYIAVFDTITATTIAAEDIVTQSFNFVPQAFVEINDAAIQSFTYAFDDTGNFVKVSADSTELSVNIENEGILQLGITDEVSFVFSITSAAFAEIESFDDVSKSVSDRSVGAIEWDAKTFAKGYTKWQQIYADDTIGLTLKGEGDGMKISAVQQVSRQQWIG